MEEEDGDSSASGVYVDITDYLNDKFGTFSDKPSDIDSYLKDKFPEL